MNNKMYKLLILCVLCCYQAKSQDKIDLEQGIVIYFPFDGDAFDYSGNDNHGIMKGGARFTEGVRGDSRSAVLFNGFDSYVSTGKTFDYPSRSVSIWINARSNSGFTPNNPVMVTHDAHYLNYGLFRIDFNGGVMSLKGSGTKGVYQNASIELNKWYHIVMIRDKETVKYYLDGVKVYEAIGGDEGSSYDPNPELILGAGRSKIRQFYNGKIDEFRLYDRAINECELIELYYDGLYGEDRSNGNVLKAYYAFDGNLEDSSNLTNTAIFNGNLQFGRDRFNYPNSSIRFDGKGDYLESPKSFDFDELSVSVWVKLDKSVGDDSSQVILYQNHLEHMYGDLFIERKGAEIKLAIGGDRFSKWYLLDEDSEWHLIVMVRGANYTKYFIDGQKVGQGVPRNFTGRSGVTKNLVAGMNPDISSQFFSGFLDDLRVYNRVLTECHVLELFNEYRKPYVDKDDEEKFEIILLPNPNDGKFRIKLTGISYDKITRIRVVDELGRIIYNSKGHPVNPEVILESAGSAVYFCQVWLDNTLYTFPFAKID